ncbi:MAG: hypothetical protein EZS28_048181 [Streblomastix strix]|uniref:START domain-containing protein n=1 Tax=Streblomastix strix TaxID=222440 RepID=A0A5J4TET5_9EUKA|nr:MAG: hypothetical protein EZS28_048181 [Streblomastix strix]
MLGQLAAEDEEVIASFVQELEAAESGQPGWVFVATLNDVDIFHRAYDKHIGLRAEGFIPEINIGMFNAFLKQPVNRPTFDKYCIDGSVSERQSPDCDLVILKFKCWPAAPRDVLLKRVYKSIEDKTFLIASTSITNFSFEQFLLQFLT